MPGLDRHSVLDQVRTTLAADLACQPSDWLRDGVTLVEAREVEGRLRFPLRAKPFMMTTMGQGVVISCGVERMAWVEANLCHQSGDDLFSIATLAQITNFVAFDQQTLAGPLPKYICASETFRPASLPPGFALELFEQEAMAEVYRFKGFDHALSYDLNHACPDVLAVVAWHDGQVVGIAGASADSDQLWQIGINVVPEHQGIGLGKALVSRATEIILERGKAPFYAHRLTNIKSGNTARSLGYQLAWIDVYVRDL